MITEDQSDVIRFLSSPSTHGGADVERVETHASIVFLAGARAWKLKRAVRYTYLDFSTVDRRRACCDAEFRINHRAAPGLYLGVVPIVRAADGRLALGGEGTPEDWVIEMRRFDQVDLLDRRAAAGTLDLSLMRPLAAAVAALHREAERRPDQGGAAGMAWVVEGNAADLARTGAGVLDPAVRRALEVQTRQVLDRVAPQLEERRRAGYVRQCHGDLHLRNIVLFDGVPTLFDAVEFDDRIACIDVLYDLAFLLMDLWKRRLPGHASAVWNGYLAETGDIEGASLLPLFLSCRAAVRSKTSLAAAALESDEGRQAELHRTAAEYLAMALELIAPAPPSIVAIGGLSGSGKSSLAYALAPEVGAVPGAVVVRSDEVRKQLLGVPALTRLGSGGYREEVSRRVYAELFERASAVVGAGQAAILDAVFARSEDREAAETVAARAGVPFAGIWLETPEAVLIERVRHRQADASDADEAVVRAQVAAGAGDVGWTRIAADAGAESVRVRARELLGLRLTRG